MKIFSKLLTFACLLIILSSAMIFQTGCGDNDPSMDFVDPSTYTRVIILSGQSNAIGPSLLENLKNHMNEEQLQRIFTPNPNIKIASQDTNNEFINYYAGAVGYVPGKTFGPELGICETLSALEGKTYVIKCAFSGTSLYADWVGPSMAKDGQVSYCYKVFTEYVDARLEELKDQGLNPKIVGMCWMQGEADSSTIEAASNYENNLNCFVSDLRERYNSCSLYGKMNFIDAKVATNLPAGTIVNDKKSSFAQRSRFNHLLDTTAYGLVYPNEYGLGYHEAIYGSTEPDFLHYDSKSMLKLGNMFGEKLLEILQIR